MSVSSSHHSAADNPSSRSFHPSYPLLSVSIRLALQPGSQHEGLHNFSVPLASLPFALPLTTGTGFHMPQKLSCTVLLLAGCMADAYLEDSGPCSREAFPSCMMRTDPI